MTADGDTEEESKGGRREKKENAGEYKTRKLKQNTNVREKK